MKYQKNMKNFILEHNLSEILIDDVIPHLRLERYKKGTLILSAHENVDSIYFLVEGKLEISSIMLSGNKIFINNLFPLEIFGDVEFLNEKDTLFDVLAITECLCIILPFDVIKKHLQENYHFWKLLAMESNTKLLKTNMATLLKGSYSLKTILSNYIVNNGYEIRFNSLSELALQFNVSYRNLSRVIKSLSEDGIVVKERKRIVALNREALRRYSAEL